ncbi:MAG: hypothetical protein M1816_007683 [Peltula sp. TS41687]|nr:MAG: hypothetical protein M1816_007683 [Peltula sp. TS41687]
MASNTTSPSSQKYTSMLEGLEEPTINQSSAQGGTNAGQPNNNNNNHQGDPFAGQRTADNNPFAGGDAHKHSTSAVVEGVADSSAAPVKRDRRESKEWDASKVPPSRFQKIEGSIYATPSSRDGHVDRNTQTAYAEKLREKVRY